MSWINSAGQVYSGDCMPGDRAATDAEVTTWQATIATSSLRAQAQAALDANDRVAIRCTKAGVVYPAAWLAYDLALRAVVAGTSATLPTAPAYPAGT